MTCCVLCTDYRIFMKNLPELYAFLIHAARTQGNTAQFARLQEAAAKIENWDDLAHLAELHGIAPLVYTHLQAAAINIPQLAENELKARYLQHSHASNIRAKVLGEILAAFQAVEIEVLLLKGMAMAHLVYPQPFLRPMSDIDLLVSKGNAQQAQAQLKTLGFSSQTPQKDDFEHHHHLPVAYRYVEGISIHVEIHHNLNRRLTPATSFEALRPAAITFMIKNVPAYTLSHADLLAHTYSHMVGAPFQSFRLIWIADMVSLVERFGDEINWERLPLRVCNALAAIYWLTPFRLPRSERVYLTAPSLPYQRVAQMRGWPFTVTPAQNESEYASNIPKAFRPSSWWLRLYHGLSPDHWLIVVRARHYFHLFWWVLQFRNPAHIIRRIKEYAIRAIRGSL